MRCRSNCCRNGCCRDGCRRAGQCAVAFGLGLVCSCFCPVGLIMFVVAVIMVLLGVSLLRE